jgi:hypothetical protein
VINVDLPWNPAKLEQRIARAWRKHQTRSVSVINLVAEKTIEHSILHLLDAKQALADGVLDGWGDLASLKMPSGRGALVERMRAMLEGVDKPGPRIVPPQEALAEEFRRRHGERVLRIESRSGPASQTRLLAVLDLDDAALAAEQARLNAARGAVPVEIVGKAAWLVVRRLMGAGLVGMTGGEARVLHADPAYADTPAPPQARAALWRAEADRALRMAGALTAGGIPDEAPPLLAAALRALVAARRQAAGEPCAEPALADPEQLRPVAGSVVEAKSLAALLAALRPGAVSPAAAPAADLVETAARLVTALWPDQADVAPDAAEMKVA